MSNTCPGGRSPPPHGGLWAAEVGMCGMSSSGSKERRPVMPMKVLGQLCVSLHADLEVGFMCIRGA